MPLVPLKCTKKRKMDTASRFAVSSCDYLGAIFSTVFPIVLMYTEWALELIRRCFCCCCATFFLPFHLFVCLSAVISDTANAPPFAANLLTLHCSWCFFPSIASWMAKHSRVFEKMKDLKFSQEKHFFESSFSCCCFFRQWLAASHCVLSSSLPHTLNMLKSRWHRLPRR